MLFSIFQIRLSCEVLFCRIDLLIPNPPCVFGLVILSHEMVCIFFFIFILTPEEVFEFFVYTGESAFGEIKGVHGMI